MTAKRNIAPPPEATAPVPAGKHEATRSKAARTWLDENAEAIRSYNSWIEKHGLPLQKHRSF
jgi:antitoxin CcdA